MSGEDEDIIARKRALELLDSASSMVGFVKALGNMSSRLETTAMMALSGMLSNPSYDPLSNTGETKPEAYARKACDYGEALIAEVARRELDGKERTS